MAGDDRVLAVAMFFFLPAMFAIDMHNRPRAHKLRILHDREAVMARVGRFSSGGLAYIPTLLAEYSDHCNLAEANRGEVPEPSQQERLEKVVDYIQRGD